MGATTTPESLSLLLWSTAGLRVLASGLLLIIASPVGGLWIEYVRIQKKYRFPPLVPGLPLVGNTFQMPATDHGPYLKKLGDKYGEMYVRCDWCLLCLIYI